MAVERLAILAVNGRVSLSRDDQPVFPNVLGPFAHAVLREIVRIAQHHLHVLGMLEQPARLIARKDVGHIADRRQRLMRLRDQRLLWIFKNRFAAEQRQRNCQFRRNMRSEEHTSELQSLMRNSYAVFCLKKKISINITY